METELLEFVRESLSRGLPRGRIRQVLIDAGWSEDEVKKALAAFARSRFPVAVPRPRPYLSAREAFLYLVQFLTLYTSAIGLGALLFQLIGRAFPDPLETAWQAEASLSTIRWSTASILVAFPVFLLLARAMRRALESDPEKRGSRVRKWLTYLTLFVAASVLLADFITLLFNALEGDLSVRFLSKVATVAVISAVVFGYYLWELRQDEREPSPERPATRRGLRLLATAVSGVTAAAVVAGFFVAGSPGAARLKRLDERRVADLSSIARAIDGYWKRQGELPQSLEELSRDRQAAVESIHDPLSDEPYRYRVTGGRTYELCADFQTASADEMSGYGESRFWGHEAGPACFPVEVRGD